MLFEKLVFQILGFIFKYMFFKYFPLEAACIHETNDTVSFRALLQFYIVKNIKSSLNDNEPRFVAENCENGLGGGASQSAL